MTKLNRGKVRKTTLAPKGIPTRTTNDISKSVQTRVGKQAKFGPRKGKATPGLKFNRPKKLGG
jgi:hypothetical protein